MSIPVPLRTALNGLTKGVENALLAQDCFLCGAASGAAFLCPACRDTLPRLPASRCPICALPTAAGEACGSCLRRPPNFDATFAEYAYAFPVDRLVQALKYEHRLAVAAFFGAGIADAFTPAAEMVVAMPLHSARLRERGFNQALEIARFAVTQWRIRVEPEAVERTDDGPPQASLPWRERRRNVRGAFLCRADLSGRHALVVDDVMTSGATLDELARALKARGATRVTNCVVARTLPA